MRSSFHMLEEFFIPKSKPVSLIIQKIKQRNKRKTKTCRTNFIVHVYQFTILSHRDALSGLTVLSTRCGDVIEIVKDTQGII